LFTKLEERTVSSTTTDPPGAEMHVAFDAEQFVTFTLLTSTTIAFPKWKAPRELLPVDAKQESVPTISINDRLDPSK
jgi:hypothetical protein